MYHFAVSSVIRFLVAKYQREPLIEKKMAQQFISFSTDHISSQLKALHTISQP